MEKIWIFMIVTEALTMSMLLLKCLVIECTQRDYEQMAYTTLNMLMTLSMLLMQRLVIECTQRDDHEQMAYMTLIMIMSQSMSIVNGGYNYHSVRCIKLK